MAVTKVVDPDNDMMRMMTRNYLHPHSHQREREKDEFLYRAMRSQHDAEDAIKELMRRNEKLEYEIRVRENALMQNQMMAYPHNLNESAKQKISKAPSVKQSKVLLLLSH
jgi:hypothetical protein